MGASPLSGLMCACVLVFVTSISPVLAASDNIVLPVDSQAMTGKTYGEWSANWWQTVLSLPADENPLLDDTGATCALGQDPDSPVFFLVDSVGAT